MSKQDKFTRSARGKACTVRIPGVCRQHPDNETTVLAHLNGAGMGFKASNIHGAFCCAECHQWLDGGYSKTHTRQMRDLYHLEGVIRTQIIMIDEGILKL